MLQILILLTFSLEGMGMLKAGQAPPTRRVELFSAPSGLRLVQESALQQTFCINRLYRTEL